MSMGLLPPVFRSPVFRPPAFWQTGGLPARLLMPLACLYAQAARWRWRRETPQDCGVPVICVGNLTAGGQGKTPVVLSLAELLYGLGRMPAVLSRGYGGRLQGPMRVDPARHTAADVGDEPLLLARHLPAYICPDRRLSAAVAQAHGADVLLMDDGFQNPGLQKTLSLIVVDGATGFGNGRVMPAGPLREPLEDGFARADAVVLLGEDRTGLVGRLPHRLPLLRAEAVAGPLPQAAQGRPLLAFAGIGRPQKFYESLAVLGAAPVETADFPDHHAYGAADLDRLRARAAALGAVLITTAKDAVRLPPGFAEVLPLSVNWRDAGAVMTLLERAL
jgi:tetraacyldisaccharide 4'-kinase